MKMIDELMDVFCCPSCKQKLIMKETSLLCTECKKQVIMENRLMDVSHMSPNLPLTLNNHLQQITEEAAKLMEDVEVDWRVNRVLDEVKKNSNGSLCLEIGGADGPMTPTLESLFNNVISIDCSINFLKRIEAKTKKTICIFGDANFLPLADKSVDMIVCSEVLEHAIIPTQLLTEIQRVIKKEGKIILSVPNESSFHFHKKLVHLPGRDTHINFFTPESLETLLFRTGFNIISMQTVFPPNTSWKSFLSNIYRAINKNFYGVYIVCTLKSMEKPWQYWESFINRIQTDN